MGKKTVPPAVNTLPAAKKDARSSRKSTVYSKFLSTSDQLSESQDTNIRLSGLSDADLVPEDESMKKAHALAYKVLSKEDTDELLGMTAVEMESKLKDVLSLSPTTCLRDAATLDFFVGAVYWGKKKDFTNQQLSGFFTVIHVLLHKLKDDHVSLIELLKEFRNQLIGIGAELSPEIQSGGIEFFSVDQASAITDFLQSTLFQHFKLYEFMFTENQEEEIVGSELTVEVPLPANTPYPPPLDEGMSEDTYRNFFSIPTPSASDLQGDDKDIVEEETVTAELPPEAADLFAKLTPEDVKNVVEEVSREMLQSLQVGVESKLRGTENAILARINKIHNVLPEARDSTSHEEYPKRDIEA